MSGFGWIVPPISWPTIAIVVSYNVVWAFALSAIRAAVEHLNDHATPLHRKHQALVTNDLKLFPTGLGNRSRGDYVV